MLKSAMKALGIIGEGKAKSDDHAEEYIITVSYSANGQSAWDRYNHWRWEIHREGQPLTSIARGYAKSERAAHKDAKKTLADALKRAALVAREPSVRKIKVMR
jgi:hypothetical protein